MPWCTYEHTGIRGAGVLEMSAGLVRAVERGNDEVDKAREELRLGMNGGEGSRGRERRL